MPLDQPPSQSEIEAFEQDGAVALRGVIDDEWLKRLTDAIDRDIENPGPFNHTYEAEGGKGKFYGNLRMWETDPDIREYCFHSPLPALAQAFFGSSKVNLLYDQLFVKEPGTANRTRWHNDQPYWPVRGRQVMSFWLALDRTTADSGAMEFVRGSHNWDRWFQPERFGKDATGSSYERNPDYETMPDIDAARDDYEIMTWDLEPGDVYAFHAMTVHGAGGNLRNDVRRRGLTIRYTGDDATYDPRPGTSPVMHVEGLGVGAPMDSDLYPIILPRS